MDSDFTVIYLVCSDIPPKKSNPQNPTAGCLLAVALSLILPSVEESKCCIAANRCRCSFTFICSELAWAKMSEIVLGLSGWCQPDFSSGWETRERGQEETAEPLMVWAAAIAHIAAVCACCVCRKQKNNKKKMKSIIYDDTISAAL